MRRSLAFPAAALCVMHPGARADHVPFESIETARSSNEFVVAFGQIVEFPDMDHDGAITDYDVIAYLAGPFTCATVTDLNADGAVDIIDARLTLTTLLMALSGDLNADAVIDATDVGLANAAANGDPEVTPLLEGQPIALDASDLALIAAQAGSGGGAGTWLTMEPIDTLTGVLLPDEPGAGDVGGVEENDHVGFFSSQYPGGERPLYYPKNHSVSVTTQWGHFQATSDIHDMVHSNSSWPANHENHISWGWDQNPTSAHQLMVSRLYWPPDHLVAESQGWPTPSHDPIQYHRWDVSRAWPPNHQFTNTRTLEHRTDWSAVYPDQPARLTPRPSDHAEIISQSWGPVHDEALSLYGWPPNHNGSVSSTWSTPSHMYQTSLNWPPSHYHSMSATWPDGMRPQWPANHVRASSNSWAEPDEDMPWFPADHSLLTTAQDIKDLVVE